MISYGNGQASMYFEGRRQTSNESAVPFYLFNKDVGFLMSLSDQDNTEKTFISSRVHTMLNQMLQKLAKDTNSNEISPPPPYEQKPKTQPFEPSWSQVVEPGNASSNITYSSAGESSSKEPIVHTDNTQIPAYDVLDGNGVIYNAKPGSEQLALPILHLNEQ